MAKTHSFAVTGPSWQLARELRQAELEARAAVLAAHEAELAAAKAERGPPGSVDDIKQAEAAWRLLQHAAETALEMCDDRPREE